VASGSAPRSRVRSAPRRLLLDEPFAALDARLRDQLRDDLLALQAERGIPWVLITHDPHDLDRCADVVISLEHGRVVGDSGLGGVRGTAAA
jgi:ABC-type sulfate/molybdate transport systems ATPase subunit